MDKDDETNPRQKTRRRLIIIAIVLGTLIILTPFGLALYGRLTQGAWPEWTGFGDFIGPTLGNNQEFQRGKTLWDLMQLLIIPAVLAIGALLFNAAERRTEREIARQRDHTARELSRDRLQEEALQGYLDRMTELLLEKRLRTSEPGAEVRDVARARTLTTLRGLDGERKGILLRFLYESDFLHKNDPIVDMTNADLAGANLIRAILEGADLQKVNLSEAKMTLVNLESANLAGSYFVQASLGGVSLKRANLINADLTEAKMWSCDLREADLSVAYLTQTDLTGADLTKANLTGANLIEAKLHGAKLSEANLTHAILSSEQLETAASWDGTIMPDDDVLGHLETNQGKNQ